jgi:hypothetical protein
MIPRYIMILDIQSDDADSVIYRCINISITNTTVLSLIRGPDPELLSSASLILLILTVCN